MKEELTKKEKERRAFERFVTKNVKVFWEGCNKMERLAKAIEVITDRLDKGDGWHGNERKDTTKKI